MCEISELKNEGIEKLMGIKTKSLTKRSQYAQEYKTKTQEKTGRMERELRGKGKK